MVETEHKAGLLVRTKRLAYSVISVCLLVRSRRLVCLQLLAHLIRIGYIVGFTLNQV